MQQNIFIRWLIKKEGNDIRVVEKKEVSRHMPINRMLDEVGHYPFKSLSFKNHTYIYTHLEEEIYQPKTIIFIGRFRNVDGKLYMEDMSDEDLLYLEIIKREIFKIK